MADSKTDIQLVLQFLIKYLTLFHIVTRSIFFTNQEGQLCLLLVLWHVLLPHLFHTQKFLYGSHLYVGVIQIEAFCLKSLEKLTEGKKHLFGIMWLEKNFNLHVQIWHGSLPKNYLWTCFPKKERAHLFISCPKKTKSFKENFLLILQSSSFKMDSNRKLLNVGFFWDKPQKRCANIIADSDTFKRYRDFETWVGKWSNWNGGVIIFLHYFLTNVVITG